MKPLRTPILLAAAALTSCAQVSEFIRTATGPYATPGTAPQDTGKQPPTGEPGQPATLNTPPPIFGDWWTHHPEGMRQTKQPHTGDPCDSVPRVVYDTPNTYLPVNIPGGAHGGPTYKPGGWYAWYAHCLAHKFDEAGAPLAVLIRERNCPFPYATGGHPVSPDEVVHMLDAVPKLDYLLMDLEAFNGGTFEDVRKNVDEIVRLVRSHPNPRISNARIGNYNDYPGRRDDAAIYKNRRDRTKTMTWNNDRDAFYRRYFDIAMPAAYPYKIYSVHAIRAAQKGPTSPNKRSAIFWAPLERISEAARNLPEGHLLIPWVSNYIEHDKREDIYNAPPPPREDLEAMIRHARLRGAYSYMVWTTNRDDTDHPAVDYDEYKRLAMRAWASLDPLLGTGSPSQTQPTILNLQTDKASGVEWSGMIAGDRVWVLVSNLGPRDGVAIDLPDLPGLPDSTPPVPRGQHRLFRWRLDR